MDVEGAAAEAVDGGEDVVGGLGPAERLGIGVSGVDVGVDGGFQGLGGSMGAALDLLFGQEREEALDLIDPGRGGRREVACQRGRLANQSRISLVLWLDALSMMTCMSRSAGTLRSTSSRNRRNSCARWRGMHLPMIVPAFTSSAANSEVVPCRL